MRVFVLGANGFVGRRLVAALSGQDAVRDVIAGVRRTVEPGTFPAQVTQRIVDATDPAALRDQMAGASHVVNCVMGSVQAMVQSAEACAGAVAQGQVGRLVHLSSVAVYGDRSGPISTADFPGTAADSYAAAKIAAEHAVQASAPAQSVVLRPGLVHGPGSALWTLRIARLLIAGRIGPMGAKGEGNCNLVHVDDVVDAIVAACLNDAAAGRAYDLVQPAPPSWNAYLQDFAQALNVSPRPMSGGRLLTERLAAYPLTALHKMGGRLGRSAPEAITPGLARLFGQRAMFDSTGAAALLPQWRTYRDTLPAAAAWANATLGRTA